jgi:hypothetical protein
MAKRKAHIPLLRRGAFALLPAGLVSLSLNGIMVIHVEVMVAILGYKALWTDVYNVSWDLARKRSQVTKMTIDERHCTVTNDDDVSRGDKVQYIWILPLHRALQKTAKRARGKVGPVILWERLWESWFRVLLYYMLSSTDFMLRRRRIDHCWWTSLQSLDGT